jgi:hypothetical protein
MNQYEIDECVYRTIGTPMEPYARYLQAWQRIVDENSDGWPYWTAGRRCADTLVEALQGPGRFNDKPFDTVKARRGVTRIKAFATKHKLLAPIFTEIR